MVRPVKVSRDAFRVLTWLPGADRPDEWLNATALAALMADLYDARMADAVPGLIGWCKREGLVVRRNLPSGPVYRRTPTATALLEQRASRE